MTHQASSLDLAAQRAQFPALQLTVDGQPAVYFDGPGGTQVPQRVIDAISNALSVGISNLGGPFAASQHSVRIVAQARSAVADLLNASRPSEITFGQNMTSLTFALSRAISQTWQEGDEVIVTRLDHDANISPWLRAAADRGVVVRWLDFDVEDCTVMLDQLPDLLNERTRLLAINYASNAVGSITDVARAIELAHATGALVFVDAVHFAPHGLIDVAALDVDFLACSAYKFFGPHTGILYGKRSLLEEVEAYKVRPAPTQPPGKWETGTQSFESLAGVTAAVDYIASIAGASGSRREQVVASMAAVKAYEQGLSDRFLAGISAESAISLHGIDAAHGRCPTFAIGVEGHSPAEVAKFLGKRGIFVWHGHYYAVAVMERLGLLDKGGLVRIGFAHYNSAEEVDRLLAALHELIHG